jgi:dihydroorotase
MPNLSPPVTQWQQARDYLDRIKNYIPSNINFQPLMTLYLTENLQPKDIIAAKQSGLIVAYKLYPAHATTHSQAGIKNLQQIYPLLEQMEKSDLLLLIHGEVTNAEIDIFDREAVFIERYLAPLLRTFPQLRMVLEHISSKTAVDFIRQSPSNLAATITPHHLLLNRNQLLAHGIRPHHYCAPIVKTSDDQHALIHAATSGNAKFFLGTDSAPHSQIKKESACGAAGIYNGCAAIEFYAEAFMRANALDKLENFSSRFGAEFYRLPINTDKITLVKQPWQIPTALPFGEETVIPLMAGETLSWRIKE